MGGDGRREEAVMGEAVGSRRWGARWGGGEVAGRLGSGRQVGLKPPPDPLHCSQVDPATNPFYSFP